MSELTHLDEDGNPRMVNVGEKPNTHRVAVAEGWVHLSKDALVAVTDGGVQKGDVCAIARLAGIQAAKKTSDLIPLCHPLPIDGVEVDVTPKDGAIYICARVNTCWRTGVEMEAMTAVMGAALTVYDMIKSMDRGVRIEGVQLLEKSGGRSGHWKNRSE